jgi:hypothetical protein
VILNFSRVLESSSSAFFFPLTFPHLTFPPFSTPSTTTAAAELMQASRGAVKVTIISADALKKKQLETIQAGIMSMVGAGKSVSDQAGLFPVCTSSAQLLLRFRCVRFRTMGLCQHDRPTCLTFFFLKCTNAPRRWTS